MKTRKRPGPPAKRASKQTGDSRIDSDIREMTSLMFATMGRFQVMRRTLASCLSLTPMEFAVVLTIHQRGPGEGSRVRELADDTYTAPANVTQTVKSLESKGWVVKRPHPRDTRALSIELLKPARERLDQFFETVHPANEIWFKNIAKSDQITVKAFFTRLIDQYPSALHEVRSLKRNYIKKAGSKTGA